MGYFQVRYDSRVVNYDRRGFIRLATDWTIFENFRQHILVENFHGYKKHYFLEKNAMAPFWATYGNFGQLFIPTSGNTV